MRRIIPCLLSSLLLVLGCDLPSDSPLLLKTSCSAELIDGPNFKASPNPFGGAKFQTETEAYSGQHGIALGPNKMGFTLKLEPGIGTYFMLRVRRKGAQDNKGALVISAGSGKQLKLYEATSTPWSADKGWDLLALEAYLPPTYNHEEIVAYCWNTGKDTVYFDDFEVEVHTHKVYKQQIGMTSIDLHFSEESQAYFSQSVQSAHEKGFITGAEKKYQEAIAMIDSSEHPAKIKIKGDKLDHVVGRKWSKRVVLNPGQKEKSEVFSLHTPMARNFLHEWLLHKWAFQEDVITSKYDFVNVLFNGDPRGVYAKEEHFTPEMPDRYGRPKSVIIRFDEEGFWELHGNPANIASFVSASIDPFDHDRVREDTTLQKYFLRARNLLYKYRAGELNVDQVFDTDRLARYFAMTSISQGYHGFIWHNMRFYYNPILDRLEPVLYDAFGGPDEGDTRNPIGFNLPCDQQPTQLDDKAWEFKLRPFESETFKTAYSKYLQLYASEEYQTTLIKNHTTEIQKWWQILANEFPHYQFDRHCFLNNANAMRSNISTTIERVNKASCLFEVDHTLNYEPCETVPLSKYASVKAFRQSIDSGYQQLKVINYYCAPVEVIVQSDSKNLNVLDTIDPNFNNGKGLHKINYPVGDDIMIRDPNKGDLILCPIDPWPAPSLFKD